MSSTRPGPRERLISTAITMVQERGVHATGLADLLKRSSAARNSIYQHFPGGKEELMVAATETASRRVCARIDRLAVENTPAGVVSAMIRRWIADLEYADYDTGCPIAAAALASPDETAIRTAAAEAFAELRARISATLQDAGVAREIADVRASVAISAIEGALLQARAARSAQPLRDVETVLVDLLG